MSNIQISSPLITVPWLVEHLNADNLIILDASMKPVTPVVSDVLQEEPGCIQGALRFDFDEHIRDKNTNLPHMMPSAEFFAEEMQKLGINKDSAIVAYDDVGVYSSPRAWWMFRAMGHNQIAVLDGGLPAWKKAGYPCGKQAESTGKTRGNFISHPQEGMFVESAQVLAALSDPTFSVVDARSEGRFKGQEPEPRAGLRSGHMPNAVNIPFADLVVDGFVRQPESLKSIFAKKINQNQQIKVVVIIIIVVDDVVLWTIIAVSMMSIIDDNRIKYLNYFVYFR
ncbi:MAG: sulfurtransferase, partial [Anaerolineales bacterium]|nr:sulfurtransferase [Anaerolineales bacterium]